MKNIAVAETAENIKGHREKEGKQRDGGRVKEREKERNCMLVARKQLMLMIVPWRAREGNEKLTSTKRRLNMLNFLSLLFLQRRNHYLFHLHRRASEREHHDGTTTKRTRFTGKRTRFFYHPTTLISIFRSRSVLLIKHSRRRENERANEREREENIMGWLVDD
jgi:hypothetical protein